MMNSVINVQTYPAPFLANSTMDDSVVKRRRPHRTPDQIARKRDQDREAQRLSRERTRRRIEEAESRLAECQATAANYERDLKRAVEERNAAQDEARDLRRQLDAAQVQLASVVHLIPINNSKQSSSTVPPPPDWNSNPILHGHTHQSQSPQASEVSYPRRLSNRPDPLSIRNMIHTPASSTSPAALDTGRRVSGQADLSSHGSPYYGAETSTHGSPSSVASWNDFSALVFKDSAPGCPMDNILSIFSNAKRELLRHGEPEDIVLGSRNPPLGVLPDLAAFSDTRSYHPVMQMLSEVMTKAQVNVKLPEQISFLWLTHLSLRFSISPSRENWEALPEWLRPVSSQIATPHPTWTNHIPWPQLRAVLVDRHTEFAQEDFFLPYCEGISVNWPYDPLDTFIKDEATGDLLVSEAFERHLRTLDCWTLGPAFHRTHPSLAGTYNPGR